MTTPNESLPELPQNSAQISTTFNAAMQRIDALMSLAVQSMSLTAPPATTSPDVGKCWIPATGATGAWNGQAGKIALCVGVNLWVFLTPRPFKKLYNIANGNEYRYIGTAWTAVVSPPSVETVAALPINSGGEVPVDLSGSNYLTLNLTSNVTTWTFSNPPASGQAKNILVVFKQDATGGRTVTLPASFKPLGGTDTTVKTDANAYTIMTAFTVDQGATWFYAMQDAG